MSRLPWEVLSVILMHCIEQDLEASRDILNNKPIMSTELLLISRGINNFILASETFHRLRLWKLLCYIPKRQDPIKLAVGTSDTNWTLLEVDARSERINAGQYEDILVMDEVLPLSGKRRDQYNPQGYSLIRMNYPHIPFFEFNHFLTDIIAFATMNSMSIWLWKRACTFFKKEILLSSRKKEEEFKPMFFTSQQRELMVWHIPSSETTESTTIYNTELFRRLI